MKHYIAHAYMNIDGDEVVFQLYEESGSHVKLETYFSKASEKTVTICKRLERHMEKRDFFLTVLRIDVKNLSNDDINQRTYKALEHLIQQEKSFLKFLT